MHMIRIAFVFAMLFLIVGLTGCVDTSSGVEGTAYNTTDYSVKLRCQYESTGVVPDVERVISANDTADFTLQTGGWQITATYYISGEKIDVAHLGIDEEDSSFVIKILNATVSAYAI